MKNLLTAIDIIDNLQNQETFVDIVLRGKNYKARLVNNDRFYLLKVVDIHLFENLIGEIVSELNLYINFAEYVSYSRGITTFRIIEFEDLSLKDNEASLAYSRLLIPTSTQDQFCNVIDRKRIEITARSKYSCFDSFHFTFSGVNFTFFLFSEKIGVHEPKYYCLEAQEKLSADQLLECFENFVIAYCFLSGFYIGQYIFFLQYNEDSFNDISFFKNLVRRKNMRFYFPPINIEPKYLERNETLKFKEKQRKVSSTEFSRFLDLVKSEPKFKNVLYLIVESMQESLTSGSPLLAVAFESFANLFKRPAVEKPIKNSKTFDSFSKAIEKLARSSEFDFESNELDFIKSKLTHFNTITNRDRLIFPFKTLDISLSDIDLRTINQRNNLLHGRSLKFKSTEANLSFPDKDSEVLYTYLSMMGLLSKLVLKKIGYDNYILNYIKVYEADLALEVDEFHYLKI